MATGQDPGTRGKGMKKYMDHLTSKALVVKLVALLPIDDTTYCIYLYIVWGVLSLPFHESLLTQSQCLYPTTLPIPLYY